MERSSPLERPEKLKRSLKGDTLYIQTEDDIKAATEISERFSLETRKTEKGLSLIVEGGESFIPELFRGLSVAINSVNFKRPSLDDVFINLTGREIRDADGPARPMSRRH